MSLGLTYEAAALGSEAHLGKIVNRDADEDESCTFALVSTSTTVDRQRYGSPRTAIASSGAAMIGIHSRNRHT